MKQIIDISEEVEETFEKTDDKDTYLHGFVEGYKLALQDLNIIGKENKQ